LSSGKTTQLRGINQHMVNDVINLISARQAVAVVNEWLICYVGDRFLADTPVLDARAELWGVPILYVYPREGSLGCVGEAKVDALTGVLREHPTADGIKRQALMLYQAKYGTGDSPLPAAGD
jgi:hypothetical protein